MVTIDVLVYMDEDDKPEVPSPAPSLSCLAGDVKEPTHYSKRVGHGVPSAVVWSFTPYAMGWVGNSETRNGLKVAERGTLYMPTSGLVA